MRERLAFDDEPGDRRSCVLLPGRRSTITRHRRYFDLPLPDLHLPFDGLSLLLSFDLKRGHLLTCGPPHRRDLLVRRTADRHHQLVCDTACRGDLLIRNQADRGCLPARRDKRGDISDGCADNDEKTSNKRLPLLEISPKASVPPAVFGTPD